MTQAIPDIFNEYVKVKGGHADCWTNTDASAFAFDEGKHPRAEKGKSSGGQFVSAKDATEIALKASKDISKEQIEKLGESQRIGWIGKLKQHLEKFNTPASSSEQSRIDAVKDHLQIATVHDREVRQLKSKVKYKIEKGGWNLTDDALEQADRLQKLHKEVMEMHYDAALKHAKKPHIEVEEHPEDKILGAITISLGSNKAITTTDEAVATYEENASRLSHDTRAAVTNKLIDLHNDLRDIKYFHIFDDSNESAQKGIADTHERAARISESIADALRSDHKDEKQKKIGEKTAQVFEIAAKVHRNYAKEESTLVADEEDSHKEATKAAMSATQKFAEEYDRYKASFPDNSSVMRIPWLALVPTMEISEEGLDAFKRHNGIAGYHRNTADDLERKLKIIPKDDIEGTDITEKLQRANLDAEELHRDAAAENWEYAKKDVIPDTPRDYQFRATEMSQEIADLANDMNYTAISTTMRFQEEAGAASLHAIDALTAPESGAAEKHLRTSEDHNAIVRLLLKGKYKKDEIDDEKRTALDNFILANRTAAKAHRNAAELIELKRRAEDTGEIDKDPETLTRKDLHSMLSIESDDRPDAAFGGNPGRKTSSSEGTWITIGGHPEGDRMHVGGFPIQIDGNGTIIKGRLKGTNIKHVKARFDKLKTDRHRQRFIAKMGRLDAQGTQERREELARQQQQPEQQQPGQQKGRGIEQGSGIPTQQDDGTSSGVEEEAQRPADIGASQKGSNKGQPVDIEASQDAQQAAATSKAAKVRLNRIAKRLNRYADFFEAKGQGEAAAWMGMLWQHISEVGIDDALASLGDIKGTGTPEEKIQYEGAYDELGESKEESAFIKAYLERSGIALIQTGSEVDPNAPIISAHSAKNLQELGKTVPDKSGNYVPTDQTFKNKLEETQHLPGLESSEDLDKIMGSEVTTLNKDVINKLDERYGKGKWLIKSYGDEAFAGFGIFFPEKAAQIKRDARSEILGIQNKLLTYGYTLARDKDSKSIIGVTDMESKQIYTLGSPEYNALSSKQVKKLGKQATVIGMQEQGARLPMNPEQELRDKYYHISLRRDDAGNVIGITDAKGNDHDIGTPGFQRVWDMEGGAAGHDIQRALDYDAGMKQGYQANVKYFASPAFEAVGVTAAERALGVTWESEGGKEGRCHVVIKDGKASVIPYATFASRGDSVPSVFATPDTIAMEKACQDAINQLPESERTGQLYAPDVMKTKDGWKVVELNPSAVGGGSNWLGENQFTIDSYVSHMTGREPAHVQFIRNLLKNNKDKIKQLESKAKKEGKIAPKDVPQQIAPISTQGKAAPLQPPNEAAFAFDPEQLRKPAGTHEGGQFAKTGTSGNVKTIKHGSFKVRYAHHVRSRIEDESATKMLQLPHYRQHDTHSCGFVAALSVVHYFNKNVSPKEVLKNVRPTKSGGIDRKRLVKALRQLGIDAKYKDDLTLQKLKKHIEHGNPVMLTIFPKDWTSDHWTVVQGISDDRVYLSNYKSLSLSKFHEEWYDKGEGLICSKREQSSSLAVEDEPRDERGRWTTNIKEGRNPLPQLDPQLHSEKLGTAPDYFTMKKMKYKEESIPINDLKSTQSWIRPESIEHLTKHSIEETPKIDRWRGHNIITDGNHRIIAAKLKGETHVKVNVRDFDDSVSLSIDDEGIDITSFMSDEYDTAFALDKSGHEHKGKGPHGGEFTSKGKGAAKEATPSKESAKTSKGKKSKIPGSQLPEKTRKKLRDLGMVGTFPPADVKVSDIKFADLSKGANTLKYKPLMWWNQTTKSGRISGQYRYTQEFHDRNASEKFDRVTAIEPYIAKISSLLTKQIANVKLTLRQREAATIASIIRETGLRPTDGDESVKHGHFGISSLQARHIKIVGKQARLDFIGKEGVRNQTTVSDPTNVAFLKEALKRAKSKKDFIFREANSNDAGDVLKEVAKTAGGTEDIKLKDLRTLKATQTARNVVSNFKGPPPPLTGNKDKDVKLIKKAILEMSGEVAKILNNTPVQARDNYIHPNIWAEWQKKLTKGKK